MIGPYTHNIDPVIFKIGWFYIWWYGLGFTVGFLGLFYWIRRNSPLLSMNLSDVYTLTILMASSILLGGRLVEVFVYEWPYYKNNLYHIPAIWLGGMSTHGILLGSILGIFIYSKVYKKSFLDLADVLAIAGAFAMGVGRIGNFIDGQIVGSLTDVWWGVKFPDVEGFRHPVVLYDGIKNLALIPFLILVRNTNPPRGVIMAHFVLWYGSLRIFVDLFREYRTEFFGFPPGQEFNIFMTLAGIALLVWFYRKPRRSTDSYFESIPNAKSVAINSSLFAKRLFFVLLLVIPTVTPGDWTHDIPERYGHRHPGMEHSVIYPQIGVYNEFKE